MTHQDDERLAARPRLANEQGSGGDLEARPDEAPRRFVQLHRRASPGEGLGSTFTLRLPRASKSVRPAEIEYQEHCELAGLTALVVDDVKDNLDLARYLLESAGCRVATASTAEAALALLDTQPFGLIVSDIGLPDQDGLDLMRGLPNRARVPVIVLTGHAKEEADAVLGLELGADDYVTKPVGLRELLARIRAVLRREEGAAERARRTDARTRYRFAGWELDVGGRRLTSPANEPVGLTVGEFNLLAAFLRSPQRVLSRDQLLAATRVHDEEVFDRSIDVLILRLRRKLERDPSDPRLIRTERGAGYIFAAPVEVV